MIDNNKIKNMRYAGHIVALIHKKAKEIVKPGMTVISFELMAQEIIAENRGVPLFKNYLGYGYATCLSLNSTVVHGVPDQTILKSGDFFTLDVGVKYHGYCADGATTIEVGTIKAKDQDLISATKEALSEAIAIVKPGTTLGDIGYLISKIAEKYHYNVSKQYAGHFIGKKMHEDPLVLNYGNPGKGLVLKAGMTLCIEPILIDGVEDLFVDPIDEWSVRTKHGRNAVHEEQMILVTDNGNEVLIK